MAKGVPMILEGEWRATLGISNVIALGFALSSPSSSSFVLCFVGDIPALFSTSTCSPSPFRSSSFPSSRSPSACVLDSDITVL